MAILVMLAMLLLTPPALAAPGDPFGGDVTGCFPELDMVKCETSVAKAMAKANLCLSKCRAKRVSGKLDQAAAEACEHSDPAKSCKAKFEAASAKVDALCSSPLDAASRTALFDDSLARFNAGNEDLYPCISQEPAALAGITDAHNVVRAGVGVGPMVWSEALAATAQAWADTCTDSQAPIGFLDNNPNRSVGHPYYVGENIYAEAGTATPEDAVDAWAAEAANYNYETNTCSEGICGHYTQVVWADSVELGCGISSCPGLTYQNSIVCNYGPGGNTGGQPY